MSQRRRRPTTWSTAGCPRRNSAVRPSAAQVISVSGSAFRSATAAGSMCSTSPIADSLTIRTRRGLADMESSPGQVGVRFAHSRKASSKANSLSKVKLCVFDEENQLSAASSEFAECRCRHALRAAPHQKEECLPNGNFCGMSADKTRPFTRHKHRLGSTNC